jgi:hypothetical protein
MNKIKACAEQGFAKQLTSHVPVFGVVLADSAAPPVSDVRSKANYFDKHRLVNAFLQSQIYQSLEPRC